MTADLLAFAAPLSGPDRARDLRGRLRSILVLPDSDDEPPPFPEAAISIRVTSSVGRYLRLPPIPMLLRPCPMLWATVPEAPVHEDSDPGLGEDHIHTSSQAFERAAVQEIPEAQSIEG
jgi:hypothetical protein